MKKSLVFVLMAAMTAMATPLFAEQQTSKFEIQTNPIGFFVGSYGVRGEFDLSEDGGYSLGGRLAYQSAKAVGISYTAIQVLADLRFYPSKATQGFFPYIAAGYDSFSIKDEDGVVDDFTFSRIPVVGGLGYKWVIGTSFSIDLFLGGGTYVYLSKPDTGDLIDYNTFPWNVAFDGGLSVGWRF